MHEVLQPSVRSSDSATRRYKNLLYVSNYPPCTLGGAAVIAKQLLQRYDMQRLHIICDKSWYQSANKSATESSLLPCAHHPIPSRFPWDLRPHRVFVKIAAFLNYGRAVSIERLALDLCKRHEIEGIFAPLYYPEFALAAYRVHKRTQLPLYVFETDDWTAINQDIPLARGAVAEHHALILRAAEHAWVTSPAMVRRTESRFQIKSDFLFHYVDTQLYHSPSPPEDSRFRLVYTGSINSMFADTMRLVCEWINRGQTISGRKVYLHIYSGSDVKNYVGPYVVHEGFVDHGQIPTVLSKYQAALVAVSFSGDGTIRNMVATSLFTKTIDYLAAQLPVILITPKETAQHDYFGSVSEVMVSWNEDKLRQLLEQLIADPVHYRSSSERGFAFVSKFHSIESLEKDFLSHFRVD